jgi:hypothetical protein
MCLCSSAPTPSYYNDDDVPDFLVKYQNGPGFPVYYSSQVFASFCNLILNCDIYLLYFEVNLLNNLFNIYKVLIHILIEDYNLTCRRKLLLRAVYLQGVCESFPTNCKDI